MTCTCVKKPTGKGKGKVQGYSVSTLCDECEAQRVVDAIAQVEQEQEQEAETLIAEKTRKISIDALVADGTIEVNLNGKFKKKEK